MKIIEIFSSIQGEGYHMGRPVTFIRTGGCNLHCPWCDTKNSWGDAGEEMSIDQILEQVCKYDNRFVVITGGEPTIQKEFTELVRRLESDERYVCIETNGTNAIKQGSHGPDWITCSPKPETKYEINCMPNEIKLVITEDFDEKVLARIQKEHPTTPIWLQPNGYDMQNMWSRCYVLATKYKGAVRVGVQLHKLMEVQ